MQPCVYLHNYRKKENEDAIFYDKFAFYLDKAPVFTMYDELKLIEYIKNYIKYGDKLLTIKTIDESVLSPSKPLQYCLLSMMNNNEEFVLIDDQKLFLKR